MNHWLCFIFAVTGFAAQTTRQVDLVVRENAPPAMQFGAAEVRRAVEEHSNWRARVAQQSSHTDARILLGKTGEPGLPASAVKPGKLPESFAISTTPGAVVVEGSDEVGAMYGALDFAEQIARAGDAAFPCHESGPYKSRHSWRLRGVNMFLTTSRISINPGGAFWSDEYWQGYLGMMARDRYNLLDIHGLATPSR